MESTLSSGAAAYIPYAERAASQKGVVREQTVSSAPSESGAGCGAGYGSSSLQSPAFFKRRVTQQAATVSSAPPLPPAVSSAPPLPAERFSKSRERQKAMWQPLVRYFTEASCGDSSQERRWERAGNAALSASPLGNSWREREAAKLRAKEAARLSSSERRAPDLAVPYRKEPPRKEPLEKSPPTLQAVQLQYDKHDFLERVPSLLSKIATQLSLIKKGRGREKMSHNSEFKTPVQIMGHYCVCLKKHFQIFDQRNIFDDLSWRNEQYPQRVFSGILRLLENVKERCDVRVRERCDMKELIGAIKDLLVLPRLQTSSVTTDPEKYLRHLLMVGESLWGQLEASSVPASTNMTVEDVAMRHIGAGFSGSSHPRA